MSDDILLELFNMAIQKPEYIEAALTKELDLSWLEEKLNRDDMRRFETELSEYTSRNDVLLFKTGFKCAWRLFQQCNE